jgi:hypothetical protein
MVLVARRWSWVRVLTVGLTLFEARPQSHADR